MFKNKPYELANVLIKNLAMLFMRLHGVCITVSHIIISFAIHKVSDRNAVAEYISILVESKSSKF